MIGPNEIIDLVRAFLRERAKHNASAVERNPFSVPFYRDVKLSRPPICKLAESPGPIRKTCLRYYRESDADAIPSICPFGIEVYKQDSSVGISTISSFVQGLFHRNTALACAAELPRESKKQLLIAIDQIEGTSKPSKRVLDHFASIQNLLTILNWGQRGEEIRFLAHELLTPIQGALADLDSLRASDAEEILTTRLDRNLYSIEALAKRVKHLAADPLPMRQQAMRRIPVHDIVHRIEERLRTQAEERCIRIVNSYNRGTLLVEAAPDQIELAFSCLLENALKYSFDGFPNKLGQIKVLYNDLNSSLRVRIQSLGCLITKQEIEERLIFELGYRGVHSIDRGRAGTGAGLYIAEQIVHAHGGDIGVISKPIQATQETPRALNTFDIIWPFKHQEDRKSHAPQGRRGP